MTTETETRTRRQRTVELGRYVTASGEERLLAGRRGADGVVRIYDLAVNPAGHMYRVDEGFGSWAEVAALRRDYLEQAKRLGDCPMRPGVGRAVIEIERKERSVS